MSHKVAWIIIGLAILGFAIWAFMNGAPMNPIQPNEPVACTMDAKICPDGTAVGRQGPNCEFAACPGY